MQPAEHASDAEHHTYYCVVPYHLRALINDLNGLISEKIELTHFISYIFKPVEFERENILICCKLKKLLMIEYESH